ncbi:MAG: O-antigen ligase family protein [Ruminococcaceae bacterium]|nr:O-antigen ligase family protein [Oscillospiraceae bacterium]
MEEKYQYAVELIKGLFKAENNSPFIIGISAFVALLIVAALVLKKIKPETFHRFINLVRKFAISKYFMILCLGLACLITTVKIEVGGAVMFVLIECILLLFCDDILVTTLPFLLACEFLCKMYDSFDTFIRLWPVGVAFIGALIFHFIAYRKKIVFGKLFWGILAVSISTTIGGLFAKGSWENIDGSGIFYIVALGFGMLFVYILLSSHIHTEKAYDIAEKFAYIMMLAGIFAVFMVLQHYMTLFSKVVQNPMALIDDPKFFYVQWKNNISTFLMICMPFPFYLSFKKTHHSSTFHRYWMGVLIYVALLLIQSRGGMLFGTIEFVICVVTIIFVDKQSRRKNLIAMFAMIVIGVVFLLSASDLIAVYMDKLNVDSNEVRWKLYKDAWENFKQHPIFGVGLCYSGNQAETWVPRTGAINWYQNSVLQVLASFGIVGALAYGFQFVCRMKVLLRCHTKFNYTVLLSYLGLGLMSLVNPGLFSPIPYLLILTMMFVVVEKKNEEMTDTSDLIEPIRFNEVLRNVEGKVIRTIHKK